MSDPELKPPSEADLEQLRKAFEVALDLFMKLMPPGHRLLTLAAYTASAPDVAPAMLSHVAEEQREKVRGMMAEAARDANEPNATKH